MGTTFCLDQQKIGVRHMECAFSTLYPGGVSTFVFLLPLLLVIFHHLTNIILMDEKRKRNDNVSKKWVAYTHANKTIIAKEAKETVIITIFLSQQNVTLVQGTLADSVSLTRRQKFVECFESTFCRKRTNSNSY
jgi:hypothetical protein